METPWGRAPLAEGTAWQRLWGRGAAMAEEQQEGWGYGNGVTDTPGGDEEEGPGAASVKPRKQ